MVLACRSHLGPHRLLEPVCNRTNSTPNSVQGSSSNRVDHNAMCNTVEEMSLSRLKQDEALRQKLLTSNDYSYCLVYDI
jgi:hypothetical protein